MWTGYGKADLWFTLRKKKRKKEENRRAVQGNAENNKLVMSFLLPRLGPPEITRGACLSTLITLRIKTCYLHGKHTHTTRKIGS
jgi:hypothetical protein